MSWEEEENAIKSFLADRQLVLYQPGSAVLFHVNRLFAAILFEPTIVKKSEIEDVLEILHKDKDICLMLTTVSEEDMEKILEVLSKGPYSRKATVIVVSDNFDELKVLSLALCKVDAHVLAPLTAINFKDGLINAIQASTLRKNYVKVSETASKFLEKGLVIEAQEYLEAQLRLTLRPDLGHCLLAELFFNLKYYDQALQHFVKALAFKPKNFRALKGLYTLFTTTGHQREAYNTLKKLFTLFPADTDDLCQAIRLCIQTDQINDMEKLLGLYFKQKDVSEKLDKHAAAGLAVYCQYLVTKRLFKNMRTEIEKIKKFRFSRGPFLTPLILMLRDLQRTEEVAFVLGLFRKEDIRYRDYKLATYYHYCLSESESETLRYALKIISEGVDTPLLYEETVKRLRRLGDKEQAERIKLKAKQLWPNMMI